MEGQQDSIWPLQRLGEPWVTGARLGIGRHRPDAAVRRDG